MIKTRRYKNGLERMEIEPRSDDTNVAPRRESPVFSALKGHLGLTIGRKKYSLFCTKLKNIIMQNADFAEWEV